MKFSLSTLKLHICKFRNFEFRLEHFLMIEDFLLEREREKKKQT